MSKVERWAVSGPPSIGGAVRSATFDFYYHSWRLVPANVIWGIGLLLVLTAGLIWLPGAVLLAGALAVPAIGVHRLAALIVRGDDVVLSDAFSAYRRLLGPALLVGALGIGGTLVLAVNVVAGITVMGGPMGWALATAAAWGLVFLWAWLIAACSLVADPRRDDDSLAARFRLAALLLLAYPLRMGGLLAVSVVVVTVSLVLFAAIVTISIAYCALVASRYVLPAADCLQGRATQPTVDVD
ncbi:MAG: hypothetical protein H0V36_09680 [Chloroflexi bacterium]|nr:hypothetical protein [Chloroflexota bacterium]